MKYEVVVRNATNGYILDKEGNRIVVFFSTKRPDLGFERLLDLVEQANNSKIYKKFWMDLWDEVIAEVDNDGWCRLAVTKEQALQMKKDFETI